MRKFIVTSNNVHNIILLHFNIAYSKLLLQGPKLRYHIANSHMQNYNTTYPAFAGLHNHTVETLKSTWSIAEKDGLYARTKSICCHYATQGILQICFFSNLFWLNLRLLICKDV